MSRDNHMNHLLQQQRMLVRKLEEEIKRLREERITPVFEHLKIIGGIVDKDSYVLQLEEEVQKLEHRLIERAEKNPYGNLDISLGYSAEYTYGGSLSPTYPVDTARQMVPLEYTGIVPMQDMAVPSGELIIRSGAALRAANTGSASSGRTWTDTWVISDSDTTTRNENED